ncbi:MAG: SH3 domain-containing protein [Rhodobacteraceae bacterium]|nr:SH3 domain-containing protein [Paracoccaceae bacterium]
MLRLTLFLCAAMVGALMLLGEDRGQKRPGLANAAAEGPAPVTPVAEEAAPIVVAAVPQPEPAPVVEAAPDSAVTQVAAPAPQPYVEPLREVVQAVEEPVFTLSSLGNELVPGENGTAPIDDQPAPAGDIWYVNASSVNVRAEPSTEAEVLGKLANGEAALLVSAIDDEWARIVIQGDGLEGYVALRYLSPEAP